MNVNDMEIARSIFNPKRVRILKLITDEAKTVKDMAIELNDKPSRLYYHVHKLLELGLLEVAETKQIGHLTETYYKAVPGIGSFDIDETFAKDNPNFLTNQLLVYINKAIAIMKKDMKEEKPDEEANSSASIVNAELTQDDWIDLNKRIREFIHERSEKSTAREGAPKKNITYILMSYAD